MQIHLKLRFRRRRRPRILRSLEASWKQISVKILKRYIYFVSKRLHKYICKNLNNKDHVGFNKFFPSKESI